MGETIGFQNVILRDVARGFTVIMLTNRNHPSPYAAALTIAELFLPIPEELRAARGAFGPDSGLRPLPN